MADEKAVKCYSLAKAVERIDCALQDLKVSVVPQKETRAFNGVGMALYSIQGDAKTIGNAIPEVKSATNKFVHRIKEIRDIVTTISVKPIPPVVAEFIRDDLSTLWDYQRTFLLSAEKACLRPTAEAPGLPKEKFRPIPAEVRKAVAKTRKELDQEIAKRDRKWTRTMKRIARRGKKAK